MVPSNSAILTWKPFRPALPEDDVSRNHVLVAGLFGTKTFSGRVSRPVVGTALGGMGGMADLRVVREEGEVTMFKWGGASNVSCVWPLCVERLMLHADERCGEEAVKYLQWHS